MLLGVGEVLRGIIPACAGSTLHPCQNLLEIEDHPRLRGEHAMCLGGGKLGEGSSPLARGALHVRIIYVNGKGIIPACAGSTWPARTSRRW